MLDSGLRTVACRGVQYSVRMWGDPLNPPLVLLHGARDSSVTFQFLVDCLSPSWFVVAPDWRGHGHSQHTPGYYWFHDFVADLEELRSQILPDCQFPIVGHSMGGNIACVFAALRPNIVTDVISLDGFGPLMSNSALEPCDVLSSHLAELNTSWQSKTYSSMQSVVDRLQKADPLLSLERATFLAAHSTALTPDGGYRWLYDPSFRRSLATLRSTSEWMSIWRRVQANVCWLSSCDSWENYPIHHPEELLLRMSAITNLTYRQISDSAHNLHHHQPAVIAEIIESFLGA